MKYSITIKWSEPDSEYVVLCPEFPGLSAFGKTREDALREAEIALGLFIETFKSHDMTLPEPLVSLI